MTVAIILGAGGPFGWAYHLGILEGVRDAIGQDPKEAARVVGTSAGAAIGAALLTGSSTEEMLDLISSPPSGEEREALRSVMAQARRHPLRTLTPVAPGLVRSVGTVGVTTAIVGLLPAGLFPTLMLRRFADGERGWPTALWVPTVRLDDGATVVFGRDTHPVSLGDALEASSAVPAVFRPKVIDGTRYVDGAVASSTHAALVADEGHDAVLISAPSARPGGGPLRARARRMLDQERAEIEAAGSHALVLVPDDDVLAAADGYPRRRPAAAMHILDAARRQTVLAFSRLRAS